MGLDEQRVKRRQEDGTDEVPLTGTTGGLRESGERLRGQREHTAASARDPFLPLFRLISRNAENKWMCWGEKIWTGKTPASAG